MKRTTKNYILLCVSLLMLILTACSSKKAVEEVKDSQIVIAEEAVIEETVAVEVVKPEPAPEAVPESTVEATPETTEGNTPEPIVYEGINMESTLSAEEWVTTFLGIIEEPRFVVTNPETNKKVIIENGQEVVLEVGDVLGLYFPSGIIVGHTGINVSEMVSYNGCYAEPKDLMVTKESEFEVKIATMEGEKSAMCVLLPN